MITSKCPFCSSTEATRQLGPVKYECGATRNWQTLEWERTDACRRQEQTNLVDAAVDLTERTKQRICICRHPATGVMRSRETQHIYEAMCDSCAVTRSVDSCHFERWGAVYGTHRGEYLKEQPNV